jgi:hypothetical protein
MVTPRGSRRCAPRPCADRAGGRWHARASHFARGHFFDIAVPADILDRRSVARVKPTSFVPDDREGNGDHRRLGLRVYDVTVTASGAIVR